MLELGLAQMQKDEDGACSSRLTKEAQRMLQIPSVETTDEQTISDSRGWYQMVGDDTKYYPIPGSITLTRYRIPLKRVTVVKISELVQTQDSAMAEVFWTTTLNDNPLIRLVEKKFGLKEGNKDNPASLNLLGMGQSFHSETRDIGVIEKASYRLTRNAAQKWQIVGR
jgi:hypothetical protein